MAVAETTGVIHHDEPKANVEASLVHTDLDPTGDAIAHYLGGGRGIGLDFGVMVSLEALSDLTMGASVQNVFNTFAWDTTKLVSQTVGASIDNPLIEREKSTVDPQLHVGVGAEYRVLGPLHLRAGLAYLTDDFSTHLFQYSGGLSGILEPVNLSVAVAAQSNGQVLGQVVLSLGNR